MDISTTASSADSAIGRNLHILFQQADSNHDGYLDKKELDTFVEVFTKRMPEVYTNAKITGDTVEAAKIIAEQLMKKQPGNLAGKLSYRGSLLRNSDAINFALLLEKVIVNLVHEVNKLQPPFSTINPFGGA